MKSIFVLVISILIFTGCSDSSSSREYNSTFENWNQYMNDYIQPNILNKNKTFDYYEIVNDKDIVYSSINIDFLNVIRYLNYEAIDYYNELYKIETDYQISNKVLDIFREEDVMIFSSYDTLTKVVKEDIYIKSYGIYQSSRNFCVFNSEKNCKSYLYINN